MLRIEEITQANDLDRLRTAWINLVSHSKDADIFQTYEWVTSWLKYFWQGKPIAFLFVWRENNLIALAPLLRDDKGEIGCRHSLVTPVNDESLRTSIITSEEPKEILLCLIRHIRKNYRTMRLVLKMTKKSSPAALHLPQLVKPFNLSIAIFEKNSSPILHLGDNWEAYLKTKSRHFQKELRRKRKKLEEAGNLQIKKILRADEFQKAMPDILAIERSSWKEKAGTSFASRPKTLNFYSELGLRLADRGCLELYLLYLNSRPVAHVFGLVYGNEYCALKTSYDNRWRYLSPGIVLFEHILKDALEQGTKIFDFLGVESRWKNDFANDVRPHVNICAFPSHLYRCQVCKLYQNFLRPFAKKEFPFLAKIKRKIQRSKP